MSGWQFASAFSLAPVTKNFHDYTMLLAAIIGREGGQNGFAFRDSFGGRNFSHKLSSVMQLSYDISYQKRGKIWFVNVYW